MDHVSAAAQPPDGHEVRYVPEGRRPSHVHRDVRCTGRLDPPGERTVRGVGAHHGDPVTGGDGCLRRSRTQIATP